MRAIRKFGSMRGVWKRSQGRATKAPPDERGGNRHARPNAIPRHTSTLPIRDVRLLGTNSARRGVRNFFQERSVLAHALR